MLTGKALGEAIKTALEKNELSKADIARLFRIKPPSVSGWIKTGRISKPNFEKLRKLLSDKVGPEHWGLSAPTTYEVRQDQASYQFDLSDEERLLIMAYRNAQAETRAGMMALARTILPERPAGFTKRTGT
jgi:transcriptional regulator with XRE-family HTH domain